MEVVSKAPRPLSLSSDDLLHEAVRMSATKFISRFPSSEKINLDDLETGGLKCESSISPACMQWISESHTSDFGNSLSSSVCTMPSTPASNLDYAPTIEDDDNCSTVTTVNLVENSRMIITEQDPHGPLQVQQQVEMVMCRWGHVEAINPERFFLKLLSSRGYDSNMIPALTSKYCSTPKTEQIQGYDIELVTAVKNSDLKYIKNLQQSGRSMSSCNKFSESIVHMACRKASFEVAEFILANGGDSNIVDDYGRTPLHDACWRMEPRFDIVTLLLDSNLELLRIVDIRGSTPLKYVREEHWVQWCAYFYHQKDKYWQPRSENSRECKRTRNS